MSNNHYNINENGTIEEADDIEMVSDTVDSEIKDNISINSKWSAYVRPEKLPFANNVHLRYNRFNPNKKYLLGDINESDAQDEMTYMHWIHNFLIENLYDKIEILTTQLNFLDMVNFTSNLLTDVEDSFKYSNKIKDKLNKTLSLSCIVFTPINSQVDILEQPKFQHFYFLDNIAKVCLTKNRTDSNCDFIYNSFKEIEIPWLTKLIKNLRKDHYLNINENINKCEYKIELNTKTPMLSHIFFNNILHK